MRPPIRLPEIPEEKQTALVKELLGITQELAQTVHSQAEEIQRLKDEVLILKGQKKRPRFRPSKMNEQPGKKDKKKRRRGKRAGSKKRRCAHGAASRGFAIQGLPRLRGAKAAD